VCERLYVYWFVSFNFSIPENGMHWDGEVRVVRLLIKTRIEIDEVLEKLRFVTNFLIWPFALMV
jgi:hypothetical protein